MTLLPFLVGLFLGLVPVTEPSPKKDEAKQALADTAAFKAFLKEQKLEGVWESGVPIRRDTPEVRKAYGTYRAYYTFGSMPLGGGAFSKERVKAYQEAMQRWRKNSLSIAVLIKDGKVTPLKKPADFNTGLMAIKTDEDARIAAAAILSLLPAGELGPQIIAAKDVKAVSDKGWTCTCRIGRTFGGDARVIFDAEGRFVSVTMPRVMLPRPPSAVKPPRP